MFALEVDKHHTVRYPLDMLNQIKAAITDTKFSPNGEIKSDQVFLILQTSFFSQFGFAGVKMFHMVEAFFPEVASMLSGILPEDF